MKYSVYIPRLVIIGFPGTGKTKLAESYPEYVADLDGPEYIGTKDNRPANWPNNMFMHIRNCKKPIICVPSHNELAQALINTRQFPILVVYPTIDLKLSYLNRYIERGSPVGFIQHMLVSFNRYINDMRNLTVDGQTLDDISFDSEYVLQKWVSGEYVKPPVMVERLYGLKDNLENLLFGYCKKTGAQLYDTPAIVSQLDAINNLHDLLSDTKD